MRNTTYTIGAGVYYRLLITKDKLADEYASYTVAETINELTYSGGLHYRVDKSEKHIEGISEDTKTITNYMISLRDETSRHGKEIDIPLNFESNRLLAEYSLNDQYVNNENYSVAIRIDVVPLENYYVSAQANYGNLYYVIYDAEGNAIAWEKSEGTSSIQFLEKYVVMPINAKYISIASVNNSYRSAYLKLCTDYKPMCTKWNNVKWVWFGDSLTEKNGTGEKNYYDFVSAETGISVLNYGKSGTGYFRTYGDNQNFLTRIEELQNVDFDIITIFGSFNDLNGGWVGGSTDSTDITQNNVFGFVNATLDRLYEIKPFVKVGIITPTPWYNSHQLEECDKYCDGLIEIAKRRSIPVLDLYRCSNLHPDKENFRLEYYNENGVQDNGTHPNSKGHERIYPQFREFLKTML
jgi:lysophospholipase L1-like esterase